MIKLLDILKEAKQVGTLYHFTPINNLLSMFADRHLLPNQEDQISTSIRANMVTRDFFKMGGIAIARLTLDGDKISHKYKIRPFSYQGKEDLGEEQIVVNGNPFPFLPYLKRIDIFLNGTTKDKIKTYIKLLQKLNIPHEIYKGSPEDHVPLKQPKHGSPEDIALDKISGIKDIQRIMYFPDMETKEIEFLVGKDKTKDKTRMLAGISSKYPEYYLVLGYNHFKKFYIDNYFNLKGEKLNIKVIPIPMYKDPKWIEKFKELHKEIHGNELLMVNIRDSYILIPKNEI